MQDELGTFKSLGANIAVVVRDNEKKVKDFWTKNKLAYIGIPDKEKKLGELYKQQWNLIKLGLMPAMFVIDTEGKIHFAYYSSNMKDISANAKVFEVLKQLKPLKKE